MIGLAGVLDGVVVADFSQTLPGPIATLLLAQMGAEVIKVEPPSGDITRQHPTIFALANRGKRSVVLDLKTEAGRKAGLALAVQADVVVEGFRPGKAEVMGIGFDVVAAGNPRVVYCSISGYGQHGPRRDHPGHDLSYLAAAGLLYGSRDLDGSQVLAPPPGVVADASSGAGLPREEGTVGSQAAVAV